MAAVPDSCAVAQAVPRAEATRALKTVTGRITSAVPSSFMVCLLPRGACQETSSSAFTVRGPNPSRLLVVPLKVTSAADALAASIIAPAGAGVVDVKISRNERALREIPICSKQDPAGLPLLISPTPEMKTLRVPHGLLVANGSAILSLWDAPGVGPIGGNWPDSIANTSVESIRTGDSTLGVDLRMESAEGARFRIMDGAGVRLQYDNASAQTAEAFDRIIDSACRMTEFGNDEDVRVMRGLLPETAAEGQRKLKDHSLNQWADALFPATGKKRVTLDGPLNASQEQVIHDKLQERLGELKATVAFLDSWLGEEFSRRIPDFTVQVNVSTRSKQPIASTRRTSEGFVIDINTVVLRSLFSASNDGSSALEFFDLRQFILKINPNDPMFQPSYGASFSSPPSASTIPKALLKFDLMDIRFNDALDFVLLHELGHIALGHEDAENGESVDCEKRRPLEAQADAFAVSILTLRDPYRLRIRRPEILRVQNDQDPGQSTVRDFFTWAYTLSGLGNVSGAACGYESAGNRRQAAESVGTSILGRVY